MASSILSESGLLRFPPSLPFPLFRFDRFHPSTVSYDTKTSSVIGERKGRPYGALPPPPPSPLARSDSPL